MSPRALLLCLVACLSGTFAWAEAPTSQQLEFFETRIRPVLVKHCYQCHSADAEQVKGGLLLDSRDGLLQGGESGPSMVPGDPQASEILAALKYESYEMPPAGKLPREVIADFEKWIKDGAADPRQTDTSEPQPQVEINQDPLWSLQPVQASQPPAVKNTAWPYNAVDQFILGRLEAEQLQPVADANPGALLRRVYFDLIGLPPSPAEQQAFLQDPSREAFVAVVDKLLASPHFGERFGRHWLDVVRFAESNGKDRDVLFPHAWRYRDYVVRSFNQDKPWDRFIQEQIAGDLLAASGEKNRDELLVATGMLAVGPKPLSMRGEQRLMEIVDDQIDVTTRAVLGLTASCARCHDHKFDPIPTVDYYSLGGIFHSTETLYGPDIRNNGKRQEEYLDQFLAVGPDAEKIVQQYTEQQQQLAKTTKQRDALKGRVAKLEQQLKAAKKEPAAEQKKTDEESSKNDKQEDAKKPEEGSAEKQSEESQKSDPDLQQQLQSARQELAELETQLKSLQKVKLPKLEFAMGVREAARPANIKVHLRGEIGKQGKEAPRGFLSAVSLPSEYQVAPQQSGRLQLAKWLTDPANPLTPRVAVNRLWQRIFGTGLVPTVDNFGRQGEKPSHPELLDYLASQFVQEGWSVKRLLRELVLSRTYQLSSVQDSAANAVDPDNRLLWRHRPRRMDVEVLRDSILAASGTLELAKPATSVVARLGYGEVGRGIDEKILAEKNPHRTLYQPILRSDLPEMLKLFDFAEPGIVVGQRAETTVPAQALFLMNSQLILEESAAMGDRVLREGGDGDEAKIIYAYQLALCRAPDKEEVVLATDFINTAFELLADKQPDAARRNRLAWSSLCQALFATAEFRFIQ